jgi:hypothetical protein
LGLVIQKAISASLLFVFVVTKFSEKPMQNVNTASWILIDLILRLSKQATIKILVLNSSIILMNNVIR